MALSRYDLLVLLSLDVFLNLLMDLVLVVLTCAFLVPLEDPLNLLFFCLELVATRGIVDKVIIAYLILYFY